jgi:hypothetical protein
VLAACGPSEAAKKKADIAAVAAESTKAVTVASRAPSGLWDVDGASERLVRAGVAPRRIDPAPKVPPFLAGATASGAFHVGRDAEVRIYIFADSAARRRATDAMNPATGSPRGSAGAWEQPSILVVAQNLAAIVIGGPDVLKERVQLALEAGLPAK